MSNKITKNSSKAVLVLMNHDVVNVMDHCVKRLDLDRSKFIRAAIREKIQRESAEPKAGQ